MGLANSFSSPERDKEEKEINAKLRGGEGERES
jgi:hypothetical protein